ncbi:putative zinc finger A20 and AN1 domain-containing stress-associated protein 8-like isoform X2 [Capsicum annuum]|uniref:Pectinesterase inhibitor domain-containing protein n=1 Tax=Capsicum annuum TaxID=4072 RepID=A0A2G2Z7W1_CAPAN|nr:putative zinc finger A20 and AN1 domain-containing stress-associated protein 8-like isoform X2 [Capsicum annuum]PHT78090.1 hypothetical protein T459_16142 [Capsicum annuum]
MAISPSSSSRSKTLVLYIIVAFFMTPSTSNYLSQVCIKSKNPRFCVQVLGLNSHRTPTQLTQEAIYVLLPIASRTTRKIHYILNVTKDDNLKEIYNVCLGYYQTTIDRLRLSVEDYLIQGLYSNVNAVGNFAQEAAFYCENEFQGKIGHVYASTLTGDNKNLDIFGSIIVSSINVLINSLLLKE